MVDRLDPVIPFTAPNNGAVVLERYVDDRFGFLRLEITRDTIELRDDCAAPTGKRACAAALRARVEQLEPTLVDINELLPPAYAQAPPRTARTTAPSASASSPSRPPPS